MNPIHLNIENGSFGFAIRNFIVASINVTNPILNDVRPFKISYT